MFIRDPGSEFFFHPGSQIRTVPIPDSGSASKNLSILTPKNDPGCSSLIRTLNFYPSRIPDPDPQHCRRVLFYCCLCSLLPCPKDEHLNVEEWATRLRQWQEQEAAKERRRLEAEDLRRKQQEELRRRQAEEEERIRQEELRYQEEEEEEEEDYDGEEEEYQEEDYQEEDNYQEGEEYDRNEDYGRGEEYGEGEDVNMEEKDEAPELDGEYEGEFFFAFCCGSVRFCHLKNFFMEEHEVKTYKTGIGFCSYFHWTLMFWFQIISHFCIFLKSLLVSTDKTSCNFLKKWKILPLC
jgi:hypothetical protein